VKPLRFTPFHGLLRLRTPAAASSEPFGSAVRQEAIDPILGASYRM
jgi:hypothetical protein